MASLKINNVSYDMEDGFIIKDKYTEELDTAVITIAIVDKLNLSPFDFVEIQDSRFGTKYFLVDTWVEEVVSFNPIKYTYTINLISETIKLQKIVLPNLSITQPIGLTPKSISTKLNEYYLTYIWRQYDELHLAPAMYDIDLSAPEMVFNRPTAFEVFNELLAKNNSVVKITNHSIGFIKLDQYGNEIDTTKLFFDTNTQSINDYANRLDTQVSNGISDTTNHATPSGITLRGGEGEAVRNDDNMQIILNAPIYDINDYSVYCYTPYTDDDTTGIAKLNITNHIVEKQIYDTYKNSSSSGYVSGNYKRDALYYTRGSNTIEGLNYDERALFGTRTTNAIYNIIHNELQNQISSTALPSYIESNVRKNVYFSIGIKTNNSFRFAVFKDKEYNATLIDNQVETEIDAKNFGKVEQDKLNRLGNKARIIEATYYSDDDIPELSDYIGSYVLAEREIVYYKDYAVFKGYLYKDFVRKNMYYGLNSKKRSTQIATESVIRNDIVNYEAKFQLTQPTYDALTRYMLMPLSLSGYFQSDIPYLEPYIFYEFPKYCLLRTYDKDNEPIHNSTDSMILTPSTFILGNSNVIHFQFKDNYSVGMRLNGSATGGDKQEYVKYVDDYGEFKRIEYAIYTNGKNDFLDNATVSNIDNYKQVADSIPLLTQQQAGYLVSNGDLIAGSVSTLYKDNRETIATSLNFNYKDSENVIIGCFAEYTGIGHPYNVADLVRVCYSTTDEYEVGDEYGLGEMQDKEDARLSIYDGVQWLTRGVYFNKLELITNIDTSNWKSWGLVERDTNRLILGINKGNESTIPTTIYLNCVRKDY